MKKIVITFILLLFISSFTCSHVFANSAGDLEQLDYSKEYKKYLALPEEERENAFVPQMYDYKPEKYEEDTFAIIKNVLVKSITLPSRYSLMDQDVIPHIISIKDQGNTGSCWAFAFAGAAEATLGMQDLKNGVTSNTYDFSERHIQYGTTRDCLNGEINKVGLNRTAGGGGTFAYAESYCLHGLGLVNEEDMPFKDAEGNVIPFDPIALNEITNKEVRTQLYDTAYFETVEAGKDHSNVMAKMKEHIMTNGGLTAQIHGDNKNDGYINMNTGAIYIPPEAATDLQVDHAVQIIGWDDNYPASNFGNDKLTKNGAWIVKNSWGEDVVISLNDYKTELKNVFYNNYTSTFNEKGINSASEIPDDVLLGLLNAMFADDGSSFDTLEAALIKSAELDGFTYDEENDTVLMKRGDNGLFYVSYEDAFIYTGVRGISKITYGKHYDNVHTYCDYGFIGLLDIEEEFETYTIFDTSKDEYIKDVGMYFFNEADVYVYVNPKNNSLEDANFQAVQLKAGNYETVDAGYHTFEFAKPLKISAGSNYVVKLKVVPKGSSNILFLDGGIVAALQYKYRETATNKCYAKWNGKMVNLSATYNSDNTIFVRTSNTDDSEKGLSINPGPTKTTYYEGDDFDPTGMKVFVEYNNGTRKEITNYSIANNKNLKLGQTKVTIIYGEYSIDQAITVKQNKVASLQVISNPNKTQYKAGYDFEPNGLKVKAIYENGEEKEITNYEIPDQYDLRSNQTSVTVSFEGKTVSIPITVEENALVSINLKKNPTKLEYVEGQKFNPDGMEIEAEFEDGLIKVLKGYTVTNGDRLALGQESVEITYEGKSVSIPVTVIEKKATKIEITKMPKTEYEIGESLDLSGGELTVTYNDESTEKVSLKSNDVEVTGFNSEEAGDITLEVKYLDLTTTLKVKINELKLPENSNFDKAKYEKGSIVAYSYEKIQKDEVVFFEGTITSIEKSEEFDSAKYYVYIGTTADETNISNWTYLGENKIEGGKLNFKVDLTAQPNIDELKNASMYFIYIKEVALRNGQEKIAIKTLQFDDDKTTLQLFVDDVEITNGNYNGGDPTTANGVLPQTGEIAVLLAVGFVLIIAFTEYRKLKKYKDIK